MPGAGAGPAPLPTPGSPGTRLSDTSPRRRCGDHEALVATSAVGIVSRLAPFPGPIPDARALATCVGSET